MARIGRLWSLPALLLGALTISAQPARAATPVRANAAATPAENVPPIVVSFNDFWTAAQGKSFAEQEALWDRYIEGPREALYRSVVWEVRDNPHWQESRQRMLQARFARYPDIASQIPAEARDIETQLPTQARRFRALFPAAAAVPRVVTVLAPDFDAKSGLLSDGTPVIALAVDTLALEKAIVGIHLAHELSHLYEAERVGVKNDGVMPDTHLTLPLFAEGLAVYVSSQVSPGYSDARYLAQSDMGALPRSRLPAAARDFLRVADSLTVDPAAHAISPLFARWFEGSNGPLNPGYPNRAGYWLGLNLIRQLRRTYSLQQLASWPPGEAQKRMHAALVEMARGRA
jgi:hypothetical protein